MKKIVKVCSYIAIFILLPLFTQVEARPLENGDIVIRESGVPLPKGGEYSFFHYGIYFEDKSGKPQVIEAPVGFVKKELSFAKVRTVPFDEWKSKAPYLGAYAPIRHFTKEQREKAVKFALDQLGKDYEFCYLNWKGNDRYSCIGLVEGAYEAADPKGEGFIPNNYEKRILREARSSTSSLYDYLITHGQRTIYFCTRVLPTGNNWWHLATANALITSDAITKFLKKVDFPEPPIQDDGKYVILKVKMFTINRKWREGYILTELNHLKKKPKITHKYLTDSKGFCVGRDTEKALE